jgi:zinc transport system permease protein
VVATRIVAELHDVQSLLLGSAVAVLPGQAHGVIALSAVLVALHLCLQRGFVEALFDADGARVRGLPVTFLHGAMMVGLAVAISVCTRVLGALPVFAFSVLPALAVLGWVHSMPQALMAAACVGGGSGAVGYFLAYVYALPVGAAQTLVAAACAGIGLVFGKLRRA